MPNGDRAALPGDSGAGGRAGRGEPAGLVELLVVRQVRLRHDAEQSALLEDGGDIEELIVDQPGQADDGQAGDSSPSLFGEQAVQRVAGRVVQRRLMEQVAAGVAGEGQFGEDEDVNLLLLGAVEQVEDALGVEAAVGDAQPRHRGRNANETVLEHVGFRLRSLFVAGQSPAPPWTSSAESGHSRPSGLRRGLSLLARRHVLSGQRRPAEIERRRFRIARS